MKNKLKQWCKQHQKQFIELGVLASFGALAVAIGAMSGKAAGLKCADELMSQLQEGYLIGKEATLVDMVIDHINEHPDIEPEGDEA